MNNRFRKKEHRCHNQLLDNQKNIYSLKNGESAKIKAILGGRQFISKAESLGIREGVEIIKVSSQMMHGPITIKVGQTQIAIGHRMANRIIIE